MDLNILRYKVSVLNDLEAQINNKPKPRYNITKKERIAIKSLKTNEKIVIKSADKGGATVIWNKKDYIAEGNRQLENQVHYKKFEQPEKTIRQFIKEVQIDLNHL